ncbi:hypothetical protein HD554DRAFT_2036743 [Boletus coccyginus]|nr:hypothetical protein HD554DRAFT_2036743 [Boletus coccyginus]
MATLEKVVGEEESICERASKPPRLHNPSRAAFTSRFNLREGLDSRHLPAGLPRMLLDNSAAKATCPLLWCTRADDMIPLAVLPHIYIRMRDPDFTTRNCPFPKQKHFGTVTLRAYFEALHGTNTSKKLWPIAKSAAMDVLDIGAAVARWVSSQFSPSAQKARRICFFDQRSSNVMIHAVFSWQDGVAYQLSYQFTCSNYPGYRSGFACRWSGAAIQVHQRFKRSPLPPHFFVIEEMDRSSYQYFSIKPAMLSENSTSRPSRGRTRASIADLLDHESWKKICVLFGTDEHGPCNENHGKDQLTTQQSKQNGLRRAREANHRLSRQSLGNAQVGETLDCGPSVLAPTIEKPKQASPTPWSTVGKIYTTPTGYAGIAALLPRFTIDELPDLQSLIYYNCSGQAYKSKSTPFVTFARTWTAGAGIVSVGIWERGNRVVTIKGVA